MKKEASSVIKALVAIAAIVGIYIVNDSVTPQRNQSQKVFDDFYKELNSRNIVDSGITSEEAASPKPGAQIEISIQQNTATEVLKYELNWSDPEKTKMALRVLDLLKTGNAFSYSDPKGTIKIIVVGSSGYKFESSLSAAELNKQMPLNLALALMRDLAS